MPHQKRVNLQDVASAAYRAVRGVEAHLLDSGLEKPLTELVKLRASQINGCAFCLDRHSRDTRDAGEDERRLHVLDAWREAPFYSAREQAALAWTEHLTRVATDGAPDAAYERLSAVFSDVEIAHLTLLIGQINLLNRIAIGTGMRPALS